jgi:hypothetical protein
LNLIFLRSKARSSPVVSIHETPQTYGLPYAQRN